MSCPLLEKLAPETRRLIYDYVLTYNKPLQHVQELRPFIKQSTQSTDFGAGEASSEDHTHTSDSIQRIDTSILTTSKLVFTEAIVAFYGSNIISVDAPICKPENVPVLRATDLALATQVVTRIRLNLDCIAAGPIKLAECVDIARKTLPAIFPKLTSASVYIYTDAFPKPVTILFMAADSMCGSSEFDTVQFEGVGSVVAYASDCPGLKFIVQSQNTVVHWEIDEEPPRSISLLDLTTKRMQRYSQEMPPGTVFRLAQSMFDDKRDTVVPPVPSYAVIDSGSLEFWTVVNKILRDVQSQIAFIMQRFDSRASGLNSEFELPEEQDEEEESAEEELGS